MPDYQQVISTSTLIHTGAGYLAGLVVSAASGASAPRVTIYDNTAGSGTMLLDIYIPTAAVDQPFAIFFPERYAPRFATGLYFTIANCTVTLWARGV